MPPSTYKMWPARSAHMPLVSIFSAPLVAEYAAVPAPAIGAVSDAGRLKPGPAAEGAGGRRRAG